MSHFTLTQVQAGQAQVSGTPQTVETSGYDTPGSGAARYVYDSQVTTNSRTTFVSAGRGYRLALDQAITPFMFGAVGRKGSLEAPGSVANLNDDTNALQAFLDFVSSHRCDQVNWGGIFGVSASLILGGALNGFSYQSEESAYTFEGSMVLGVIANITGAVLRIRGQKGMRYGPITIRSEDFYSSYASRLYDFGVLVEDIAGRQTFDYVEATSARVAGLHFSTDNFPNYLETVPPHTHLTYSNTFACHVTNSFFGGCGSGGLAAGSFLTASYQEKAETGSAGSGDQRSTMKVSVLPPETAEDNVVPIHVQIASDIYAVTSIDRTLGTISVYPWVDLTTPDAGSLKYIFGGGMIMQGGDANVITGRVTSTNCSAGLVASALYNGQLTGVFQFCLIGLTVGSGIGNASLGGSLETGYFEGCAIDLMWNAANLSTNSYFTLKDTHSFFITKIKKFGVRYAGNNVADNPLSGLMVRAATGWWSYENKRDVEGNWSECFATFDRPFFELIPLRSNNPRIIVAPPGIPDLTNTFGYRARRVTVTGTGTGGTPTGSLTIVPLAPPGVTGNPTRINGGAPGANATFTGFSGPIDVLIEMDPADANNFLVNIVAGKSSASLPYLRASMQHASLGAGVQQSIPAAAFTRLALSSTEDNRSAFDNTSRIYTIPETGIYDCHLKVRPVDGLAAAGASYGIGIDTAQGDGVSFFWSELNGPRQGIQNRVRRTFTVGDQVRAFIYSDVALNVNGAELVISKTG